MNPEVDARWRSSETQQRLQGSYRIALAVFAVLSKMTSACHQLSPSVSRLSTTLLSYRRKLQQQQQQPVSVWRRLHDEGSRKHGKGRIDFPDRRIHIVVHE
jgi:putative N-acetylmannosamine-6-phosphate epimerase